MRRLNCRPKSANFFCCFRMFWSRLFIKINHVIKQFWKNADSTSVTTLTFALTFEKWILLFNNKLTNSIVYCRINNHTDNSQFNWIVVGGLPFFSTYIAAIVHCPSVFKIVLVFCIV